MKIAFVVGLFPTISETFILNQITGLIDLGHNVDIYAFAKSNEKKVHPGIIQYNLLNKVTYFGIPGKRNQRVLKVVKIIFRYFLFCSREIIKCLNYKKYGGKYYALNNLFLLTPFLKRQYDIIHCHFGPTGNKLIFLKDIFPKVKFITSFHGYDIRLGLEKGGGIYKGLFKKADYIISSCDYVTQILKNLGCPLHKIIYHPYGINIEKFRFNGRKIFKGYFIITTVARFVEEKNIPLTLNVIKHLKEEKQCKFRYHLIGDGYLREEIERKVSELGLNDIVVLLGALSQDEVVEKLKQTDIFLLLSKKETFGNVLLEAQAMGIPVIASNVGGVREALNNKVSGYLVSDHNIDEAKYKLIYLMENPSLILDMGIEGRKFVEENFDIQNLNKKLVDIYRNGIK